MSIISPQEATGRLLVTDDSEDGSRFSELDEQLSVRGGDDPFLYPLLVTQNSPANSFVDDDHGDLENDIHRLPAGVVFRILRWPFLLVIFLIISLELSLYALTRVWVMLQEYLLSITLRRRKSTKGVMSHAKSYGEYCQAAVALDHMLGTENWKQQDECSYFDYRLIKRVNRNLSFARQLVGRNPAEAMALKKLRRCLLDGAVKSNLGGIENLQLYSHTFYGTKQIVEEYVDEVSQSLKAVAESSLMNNDEKFRFFRKASKAYGKSALCLSGGATFGYFHLGVIKALLEHKSLPKVIAGTSAGSMIAAFVCVRTEEELIATITPDIHSKFTCCEMPAMEKLRLFWRTGAIFDPEHWAPKLDWVTKGPTTFHEAYKISGRVLNITVISDSDHAPAKLLNYKTAPDIVISSAVLASSAIPGILPRMELKRKLPDGSVVPFVEEGRFWRDGSLRIDIPLADLHRMFKVNYTIVSQVNPHVSVFFFENRGSIGNPHSHRRGQGWRGGFLVSSLEHSIKLDLKKWLRILRDLELLPRIFSQDWSQIWLQKFDGSITILPNAAWADYLHLLNDPTRERMERYIDKGMRSTWPKLKMIENRFRIESSIYKAKVHFKSLSSEHSGRKSSI
eukprot:Partr_v1_DN27029_c0_g1_i1_m29364 putative patatin-like phospholipase domain-containing protein